MQKMEYVIKDEDGYYLGAKAFTIMDDSIKYYAFTGKTTGFVFYSNLMDAEEDLKKFKYINNNYGVNKKLKIEMVNVREIKKGKGIYQEITFNKGLLFA